MHDKEVAEKMGQSYNNIMDGWLTLRLPRSLYTRKEGKV